MLFYMYISSSESRWAPNRSVESEWHINDEGCAPVKQVQHLSILNDLLTIRIGTLFKNKMFFTTLPPSKDDEIRVPREARGLRKCPVYFSNGANGPSRSIAAESPPYMYSRDRYMRTCMCMYVCMCACIRLQSKHTMYMTVHASYSRRLTSLQGFGQTVWPENARVK